MRKFYAVVMRPSYTKPIKVNMEAKDVQTALDDMYFYVGATKPSDITEYELFEVIGYNQYVPVSRKYKSKEVPTEVVVAPSSGFTEQAYKSDRHARTA